MMKNILTLLLFSIAILSCDDYLDESPDNRQTITTLKDVSEVLVSAYSEGTYNAIAEGLSDNVTDIPGNSQLPEWTENYQYLPVVSSEGQDTPGYLWTNNYTAIAHANQALDALDKIADNNTAYRNALRGEALITRAYNHFILANIFCLHYSTANASTLGIPYITAPETKLQVVYDRGTLAQTYNAIEKDLLEAMPLISDEYYVGTGKYHFTKNAALAFASRFYLFKGDFQKCIEFSNLLLGSGIVSSTFFRNMNTVFTGNSSATISNQFTQINDATNLLMVRKMTSVVTRYYRGPQPNAAKYNDIYRNSIQNSVDYRDSRWSYGSGATNPPKYTELFEYTTSTTGFPYFIMPELRSEEVILNRMEAYIQTSQFDKAIADYIAFAPSRYATVTPLLTLQRIKTFYGGTDQEAMLKFIISERRKEFLREGLRWFDIKRFDLEVTHQDYGTDINVLLQEFKLTAKDVRKAVQIPVDARANGIAPNPR